MRSVNTLRIADLVRRLRQGVVLAAIGILLLVPSRVCGDDLSEKYFEQLRRRGLFGLAEGCCLRRLSQNDLSTIDRAQLTLELSRTFAEHAKFVSGAEQTDLWSRAQRVLAEFISAQPEHPRRTLLEVQAVLIPAARAEHLRWQTELAAYDLNLKNRALSELQDVIPRLVELEETLKSLVRKSRLSEARKDAQLSPYELRGLLNNVSYRLSVTYLELAKLYAQDSADRAEALGESATGFTELAAGMPGRRITWNSQVLLAEVVRLAGDWKRNTKILSEIKRNNPPVDIRDRVVAEEVRLLLASKEYTEAAQKIVDWQRQRGSLSGELRFLNVQALLQLRQLVIAKQQQSLADELLERTQAYADRAQTEVGGFWAYRCQRLVTMELDSTRYGTELTLLIDQARSLYGAGRINEAIDAYQECVNQARQLGHSDLGADLGYTYASMLFNAKQYQQAADAFRELAQQFPSHQRAAQAHLLGAHCLKLLFAREKTKRRREEYTDALLAHRSRFANQATADEATWMLARMEEQRLQTTKALQLYQQISSDHPRGLDAKVAIARCYERILARLRDLQMPPQEWEQAAIDRLESFVSMFITAQAAPKLSVKQSEVCVRLAHIYLDQKNANFVAADRLLDLVFSSWSSRQLESSKNGAGSPDGWKPLMRTAIQLRIISLAGQDRADEAESLVKQLAQGSAAEILYVLDGLMQLAPSIKEESRRDVGELQLKTSEALNLERSKLNASQMRMLDRYLAQAFAATRQPRRSIEVYERLLKATPLDKPLLASCAELMQQVGDTQYLSKAKSTWRKLESLEKPGGPEWLNARYHVAWCCFALKQYAECRKLLGITRLLYPKLVDAELPTKFAKLEANVKQALD